MNKNRKRRVSRSTTVPSTNNQHVQGIDMATYENNEMPQQTAEEYTGALVAAMEYVAKAAGAAWGTVVSTFETSLFFSLISGIGLATYFVTAGLVIWPLFFLQVAFSTLELFLYSNVLIYSGSFAWNLLPEKARSAIGAGAEWVVAGVVSAALLPIAIVTWAWYKVASWFGPSDEARDERALNAAATLRAVS